MRQKEKFLECIAKIEDMGRKSLDIILVFMYQKYVFVNWHHPFVFVNSFHHIIIFCNFK